MVVAFGRDKNLSFVRQTPESLAMEDPVAIAHKSRPKRMRLFGDFAAPRGSRASGPGGQGPALVLLDPFPYRHTTSLMSEGDRIGRTASRGKSY